MKKSILYSLTLLFGLSHCGPKEDKSPQSRFKLDMRDYIIREDSSIVHRKDLKIGNNLNRLCHQVFKGKRSCLESVRFEINPRIRSLKLNHIPLNKIDLFLEQAQKLDTLQALSVSRTPLEKLPDFSKYKNLITLHLDHVNLQDTIKLPQYVKKLRYFGLINSKVKHLLFPKDCQIRSLTLSKNEINYLNESYYHLKELRHLVLRENNLYDVIDLNRFPKLEMVDLCGTATRPHIRERIKKQYPHIKFDFCPDEIEVIFEDDEKVKQ